jgi:hypothetical protein
VDDLVSALRDQRQFVGDGSDAGSDTDEDDTDDGDSGERSGSGGTDGGADDSGYTSSPDNPEHLEPKRNLVNGTVPRAEIEGDPNATVAVFPTRESGIPFLKENAAWGFVRVGRSIDYVAMYVTGDAREVRYVAEADRIVDPDDADLEREPLDYKDREELNENKRVIEFVPETLRELEDPIPYESRYPQSLRYSTLEKKRTAPKDVGSRA